MKRVGFNSLDTHSWILKVELSLLLVTVKWLLNESRLFKLSTFSFSSSWLGILFFSLKLSIPNQMRLPSMNSQQHDTFDLISHLNISFVERFYFFKTDKFSTFFSRCFFIKCHFFTFWHHLEGKFDVYKIVNKSSNSPFRTFVLKYSKLLVNIAAYLFFSFVQI